MLEILLLPLRQPNDEREILADRGARFFDNLNCKCRALFKRAAIFIITNIRAFPEKRIDEIAVRAVKLHPVKSGLTRGNAAFGESIGNVGNILLA